MDPALIVLIVLGVFLLIVFLKTIRIVPQAYVGIVERLGRYQRTLDPGLHILIPFIDRLRPLTDMREQVVTFNPQPVITEDNVTISVDTVIYYQVTDARAETYEVADSLQAIEQLTITTLRNVVGGLTLERALTSRDEINNNLRIVLDEATGKWGIRVQRVEIKSIDPPATIQQAMEKQMRAERDRRAAILTAEGEKQAAILTAEGRKQAQILDAEGSRESRIQVAKGEAEAIETVFQAIHTGDPTGDLLAYQYIQALPKLAQGEGNKVFVVPSDAATAVGAASILGASLAQDQNNSGK